MVKPGYKQTEIGLLPESWDTITFDECFLILPNNTFSRAELNHNGGEVQNIHYGDILVKFPAVLDCTKEGLPFINAENVLKASKGFLRDGDVIMADTAEDVIVGKSTEVIDIGEQKVVSGLHTIPCRPKDEEMFAPRWLGYFINHSTYHDQLIPYITGTKVSAVSKSAISNTLIAVPQKGEQEEIVSVLSDIDALIVNLEKLIAKKQAIKQGSMHELLTGKKRLPGFSGEWQHYQLCDLGEFLKGSGISRAESNTGKIPAVRYGELYTHHHNYVVDYISRISKDVAVKAKQVYKGDILFAASGETKEEIGKCAAVISQETIYAGGDILIFRPSVDLNPIFMGTLLNTADVCRQRAEKGQGDAVVHIHADALGRIKIRIPEITEQDAIADTLFEMDKDIKLLEQKLGKYRQVKQGMMQQLLTGKIRLV